MPRIPRNSFSQKHQKGNFGRKNNRKKTITRNFRIGRSLRWILLFIMVMWKFLNFYVTNCRKKEKNGPKKNSRRPHGQDVIFMEIWIQKVILKTKVRRDNILLNRRKWKRETEHQFISLERKVARDLQAIAGIIVHEECSPQILNSKGKKGRRSGFHF